MKIKPEQLNNLAALLLARYRSKELITIGANEAEIKARIVKIVSQNFAEEEAIEEETLAHVSLLPFKHVLPNGTYFNEDYTGDFGQQSPVLTSGLRAKP